MTKGRLYLLRLFTRFDGRCHWCGCETALPPYPPRRRQRHRQNWATRDHLRDQFRAERHVPANGDVRIVLACWSCNHERGKASVAAQPIEEIRRRSMHGGLRARARQMQAEVSA